MFRLPSAEAWRWMATGACLTLLTVIGVYAGVRVVRGRCHAEPLAPAHTKQDV